MWCVYGSKALWGTSQLLTRSSSFFLFLFSCSLPHLCQRFTIHGGNTCFYFSFRCHSSHFLPVVASLHLLNWLLLFVLNSSLTSVVCLMLIVFLSFLRPTEGKHGGLHLITSSPLLLYVPVCFLARFPSRRRTPATLISCSCVIVAVNLVQD